MFGIPNIFTIKSLIFPSSIFTKKIIKMTLSKLFNEEKPNLVEVILVEKKSPGRWIVADSTRDAIFVWQEGKDQNWKEGMALKILKPVLRNGEEFTKSTINPSLRKSSAVKLDPDYVRKVKLKYSEGDNLVATNLPTIKIDAKEKTVLDPILVKLTAVIPNKKQNLKYEKIIKAVDLNSSKILIYVYQPNIQVKAGMLLLITGLFVFKNKGDIIMASTKETTTKIEEIDEEGIIEAFQTVQLGEVVINEAELICFTNLMEFSNNFRVDLVIKNEDGEIHTINFQRFHFSSLFSDEADTEEELAKLEGKSFYLEYDHSAGNGQNYGVKINPI